MDKGGPMDKIDNTYHELRRGGIRTEPRMGDRLTMWRAEELSCTRIQFPKKATIIYLNNSDDTILWLTLIVGRPMYLLCQDWTMYII